METIIIELNHKKSYPVFIGSGLFFSSISFSSLQCGNIGILITDDHVAPMYLKVVQDFLKKLNISSNQIIIPAGEFCKSLSMLENIITQLLKKGCDRNITLFSLGGGVIGDLVGFVAAIYQRGVRFVQFPTTLLAQVDASIGGKTGINHPLGKNMIGVFHQPASVIINLDCLHSLPCREFSSGLAEVIKYAIAFDFNFFEWLEYHLDDLLKLDPISLEYCVRRCCELKRDVIKNDEYDSGGMRVLLNLGHTYGHAIESYFKYTGRWLHGEAVSIGLMMSSNLSYMFGYLTNDDLARIRSLLLRAGLPVNAPENMREEDYLSYMIRDKKNVFNQLCLVLPVALGRSKLCTNIQYELVKLSIKNLK